MADELIYKNSAINALTDGNIIYHMDDVQDIELHRIKRAAQRIIIGMPAVDAVPVAWLKEKLTGHPELSYSVTDAIQNVLDLWEAEHGRRIN